MAIDTNVPPWLNIHPQDYLQALHSGLNTGLQIAQQQNRAQEFAQQQAERRDAAREALAQRQDEADLRRWEFQQTLAMNAKRLAADVELRKAKEAEAAAYHTSNMEFRKEMEKRRVDHEAAAQKHQADLEKMAQKRYDQTERRMDAIQERADKREEGIETRKGMPTFKEQLDTVTNLPEGDPRREKWRESLLSKIPGYTEIPKEEEGPSVWDAFKGFLSGGPVGAKLAVTPTTPMPAAPTIAPSIGPAAGTLPPPTPSAPATKFVYKDGKIVPFDETDTGELNQRE